MNYTENVFVHMDHDETAREDASTPVDVLFRTDGVLPSEKLHKTVVAKINRISRRIPGAIRARVQIQRECSSRSPRTFRAHVLYEVKGNDISAEHRAESAQTALDGVAVKLNGQLRKRKTARLARRIK